MLQRAKVLTTSRNRRGSVRGARVIPIVELANKPMRTRHGGNKLRPFFRIVAWCELGAGLANEVSLTAEQLDRFAAPKASRGIKPVAPPTLGEELNDELPY
jgi:hypothetical protein